MLALKDAPGLDMDELLAHDPLIRRVTQRLEQSGYPELQDLEVSQAYGRILLLGRVRTYFLKQLAQSLALSISGVTAVENQVDVY